MKSFLSSVAILALMGTSALAQEHNHTPPPPIPPAATATASAPAAHFLDIKTSDGKVIGTLSLQPGMNGVLLRVDLVGGLTPGWHGMHFHQTADCSDAKFMASGGHINHEHSKLPHGLLNPAGPDFGDLPNLYVAADGTAHAEAYSTLVRLDPAEGQVGLRDADGSALVIHANADDQLSQPIGGAGARLACAAIK